MGLLDGKVAVVTGAGRGIGRGRISPRLRNLSVIARLLRGWSTRFGHALPGPVDARFGAVLSAAPDHMRSLASGRSGRGSPGRHRRIAA